MIGDSLTSDISGAKQAEMFTILFDKTATSSAALGYGTICLLVQTAA